MWAPYLFNGKYKLEGCRNPVKVSGYLLSPDPENNMYSSLATLQVVDIKRVNTPC